MSINIKKRIFILLSYLVTWGNISANDSVVIEQNRILPLQYKDSIAVDTAFKLKSFNSNAFNYHFSYVGLGFITSGFFIKRQKDHFRNMRHYFTPHYSKSFDNYTQYVPLIGTWVLKASGVEGRSSWKGLALSNALSLAFMGIVTNGMKYSVREMRPDGTTKNSFPSGHTAFAFAAATILHKEYGQTRSPLYSIAGYSLATLTGVGRVLNNRHWVSDVLVGAGIGIVSTDLGYFLSDVILKQRGIQRGSRLTDIYDVSKQPSFLSLGVQVYDGPNKLALNNIYDNYDSDGNPYASNDSRGVSNPLGLKLHFGTGSSVNLEGAYFFHPNIGIGGKLRVISVPVTASVDLSNGFRYYATDDQQLSRILQSNAQFVGVESTHMGAFDYQAGIYFSYPLSSRLRLGANLLVGQRFSMDYKVDAMLDVNANRMKTELLQLQNSNPSTGEKVSERTAILKHLEPFNGESVSCSTEFMSLSAKPFWVHGAGLSCIWAHKEGIAFRVHLNYDHSRASFSYDVKNRWGLSSAGNVMKIRDSFSRKISFNSLSLGFGMCLLF